MKSKEKDDERNIKKNIDYLLRVFKIQAKFKWRFLVVFILLSSIMFCWSFIPFLVARMIDALSAGGNLPDLKIEIIALFLVMIFMVTLERLRWWYEVKYLDCQVSDEVARITLSHVIKFSIGQHRDENSLVTSSKISSGEISVRNLVGMIVYQILPLAIGVFIALGMMLINYPLVGLAAILFSICVTTCSFFAGKKFSKPIEKLNEFRNKIVSKSGGEILRHLDSMLLNNEEHRKSDRHMKLRAYRKKMFRLIYFPFGLWISGGYLIANIGRFSLTVLALVLITKGNYEVGALAAIFAWSNQSLGALTQIQRFVRSLTENWGDIVIYFKILDMEPAIKQVENAHVFPTVEGKIVFEGVTYAYSGSDEQALNVISFEIKPGQKIGIVGESGAGKSTILSLLQISDFPQLGRILVDDVPLTIADFESYRNCVAFIEQYPVILDSSLRNNLLYGLSKDRLRSVDDEEIVEVLKKLQLDKLIPRLSKNVGEFGKKMSGGERQRVTIARALLKKPDMLIVDEGTSSVDSKSERIIHEALEDVSPGATRIFVAHRLSTVKNSDKIFVVGKGSLIGSGSHNELLSNCDQYLDLVKNQMINV